MEYEVLVEHVAATQPEALMGCSLSSKGQWQHLQILPSHFFHHD